MLSPLGHKKKREVDIPYNVYHQNGELYRGERWRYRGMFLETYRFRMDKKFQVESTVKKVFLTELRVWIFLQWKKIVGIIRWTRRDYPS